jgi:hypothetical protein
MAVMARSVGIPARVASGYAVGSASDDGYYHISEANAHSWPELYLGELGWVEFEPTSAQPEISRPVPQEELESRAEELQQLNEDELQTRPNIAEDRMNELDNLNNSNDIPGLASSYLASPGMLLNYLFVLAGLAVAGTLTVLEVRWRRQLKKMKPAAQAVAEMYRYAPLVGLPEKKGATADERAQNLTAILPKSGEPIANLNSLYVHEQYGDYKVPPPEGEDARATAIQVQESMWPVLYHQRVGHFVSDMRTYLNGLVTGFKRK